MEINIRVRNRIGYKSMIDEEKIADLIIAMKNKLRNRYNESLVDSLVFEYERPHRVPDMEWVEV